MEAVRPGGDQRLFGGGEGLRKRFEGKKIKKQRSCHPRNAGLKKKAKIDSHSRFGGGGDIVRSEGFIQIATLKERKKRIP